MLKQPNQNWFRVARFHLSLITISISCFSASMFAQDAKITAHLEAGEFPTAIALANTLDRDQRNRELARISKTQMNSGAANGAFETAGMVSYDSERANVLAELAQQRTGYLVPTGEQPNGQAGGITQADFDSLIDLIQNTIKPDSWQDTGQGLGTIQAYPAGVFVDATGTLKKIKIAKSNKATLIRDRARRDSGNRSAVWKTDLRMISLTRLEKAAQLLAAQGKPIPDTMLNLAGIYQVKYLMVYPETGDIVIAGPAGPWKLDQERRPVNVENGKPVLQLDDLVVCLRNAWENNGKFGCSITPRKENLAETKKFLATSKLKGKRWSEGILEALGKQDIKVFGIDAQTHAARVLVEADYRMKLVGIGLEESIPEVPSYLDRIRLTKDGKVPPMDVVRWWFTLNYEDIVSDEDRTTFTFNGTGVKVLSENEFIADNGERIHTGESNDPTAGFARDFTKHFDELSEKYPVYRQLKNVCDMALVASLIRQQQLNRKTQWHRTFFSSPRSNGGLTYQVSKGKAATQVDSVVNKKVLRFKKASSTVKHTLLGVSGGISCDMHDIVDTEFSKDDGKLAKQAADSKPDATIANWWWD